MGRWVSIAAALIVLTCVYCPRAAATAVKELPSQSAPTPAAPAPTAPPPTSAPTTAPPPTSPPTTAPAPGAQPSGGNYYGSIAYDATNCAWGTSWKYTSQADADNKALSECAGTNAKQCKVIVQVGPNQCGALAAIADCGGYGWATRGDSASAQQQAKTQCQNYNPNGTCQIQASVCSNGGN